MTLDVSALEAKILLRYPSKHEAIAMKFREDEAHTSLLNIDGTRVRIQLAGPDVFYQILPEPGEVIHLTPREQLIRAMEMFAKTQQHLKAAPAEHRLNFFKKAFGDVPSVAKVQETRYLLAGDLISYWSQLSPENQHLLENQIDRIWHDE